jgi:hypothetical protein
VHAILYALALQHAVKAQAGFAECRLDEDGGSSSVPVIPRGAGEVGIAVGCAGMGVQCRGPEAAQGR